jgi:hypothetical protein
MVISFIVILFFIWLFYFAAVTIREEIRNYPYSRKLDKEINRLLDEGVKFTNIREYYGFVDLGHLKNIWIYNYPYALGNCYDITKGKKCMPSRRTCKRLKKELSKVLDKVRLHYIGEYDYG